jgi:hypothetical protein
MSDDQQGPPRVTVDGAQVSAPSAVGRADLTPINNPAELRDHGLRGDLLTQSTDQPSGHSGKARASETLLPPSTTRFWPVT